MSTYTTAALQALGDPTRQQIIERLRGGPRAVSEIARELPVSRPAVSLHLRVLREAGLVVHRSEGTRNVYALRPEGVAVVRRWLDDLWTDALAGFAEYADRVEERNDDSR